MIKKAHLIGHCLIQQGHHLAITNIPGGCHTSLPRSLTHIMSPALAKEPDPAGGEEGRQPHLVVGQDLAFAGQVGTAHTQLPGVQTVGERGLVQPHKGVGVIPKRDV